MSSEDRELLQRFVRSRDEGAFAALVERYIGLVYHSVLRRIGDAHAAEDITQQVFTTLAQKAGRVSSHETLPGWLHTTARLETHHYIRREQRRAGREQAAAMIDDTNSAAPARDWERLRPLIDSALDQLGREDRDAVLLRFFANASFAKIGEQLGVSENAARMRVDRALGKLNGILNAKDITSVSLAAALASEAVAAGAPSAMATQVTAEALAAAPAATAGAGSILFAMTTTKAIIVTAAVAVAIAIGVATHEATAARRYASESQATNRLVAATDARVAQLRTQLDDAVATSKATKARVDELQHLLDAAKAAIKAAPATETLRPPKRYWTDPDQVRAQLAQFRADLSRFRPFYAAAHLTPKQIAEFEAIQIQWRQNLYDIWAAAEMAGLDNSVDSSASTSIARMTSDPIKIRDDKLQALLGAGAFKQYHDFDSPQAGIADHMISALAGEMYASPTPLTPTQGAELRQAIVDSTKIERVPMAADGGRQMFRLEPKTDWSAVLGAAGSILSEEQRQVLQDRITLENTPMFSDGKGGS